MMVYHRYQKETYGHELINGVNGKGEQQNLLGVVWFTGIGIGHCNPPFDLKESLELKSCDFNEIS